MMIPSPGQKVKCVFQNGSTIEGVVETWNSVGAILISDGQTILIHNPERDLLMTTILKDPDPLPEKAPSKIKEVEEEVNLRSRSLADLHILKIKAEKEEIANKVKSHQIDPDRAARSYLVDPIHFATRRKK